MNKPFFRYKLMLIDKIKTFSLLRPPRPNFNKEEVKLFEMTSISSDGRRETEYSSIPVFSKVPAEVAKKYHWVSSYKEYHFLAALMFCHRFPKHPFATLNRKITKSFSEEDILAFGDGTVKLMTKESQRKELFYSWIIRIIKIISYLFLFMFIILSIPFSIYFILNDKIGLKKEDAAVWAVALFIGWLLFAGSIPFFEKLWLKVFKSKARK